MLQSSPVKIPRT